MLININQWIITKVLYEATTKRIRIELWAQLIVQVEWRSKASITDQSSFDQ